MRCESKIKETRFNTDNTSVINFKAREQTSFSSMFDISYSSKIESFLQRVEFVPPWVTSFILNVLCAHIVEDNSKRENTKLTLEKENPIVLNALKNCWDILGTFILLQLMDSCRINDNEINYIL